jgi:hypothetical protein
MKKTFWVLAVIAICLVGYLTAIAWIGVGSANAREAHDRSAKAATDGKIRMQTEIARKKALKTMFPDTAIPVLAGLWPCAPNVADLPGLVRERSALDDENAPDTMVNVFTKAIVRARAITVSSRSILRVLKTEPGLRYVKLIEVKPLAFAYQRQAAEGCWITAATIGEAK